MSEAAVGIAVRAERGQHRRRVSTLEEQLGAPSIEEPGVAREEAAGGGEPIAHDRFDAECGPLKITSRESVSYPENRCSA